MWGAEREAGARDGCGERVKYFLGQRKMSAVVPERSFPPRPPWRVQLTGEEIDLQELSVEHSLGQTRVVYVQGEYFLEAEVLDELSDWDRAYEKALGILYIICGLAKVRRFWALPVTAASVRWTDGKGNWVGREQLPSVQYRVMPGTRYLEGANISAQILALAATDDTVRTNLIDFLGERDFSRLRRIVDLILLDLGDGDKKKGVAEVIHRGWVDEPECVRLDDSLNFGNRDYLGAHTRLERRPDQNKDPMSLVMAADFVRRLLAQWITSKLGEAG
jgi:hypothetical protein